MNTKTTMLMTIALSAMLFALPARATAQAETGRNHFSVYGPHILTGGQSLRVAIQHPRISGEIVPCIKVTVAFDVYESAADGSVRLLFVRRVLREVELDPGEAAVFDFDLARNGQWVSPIVLARPVENNAPDRERIATTVTLLQGGRTLLNLPFVLKGFDPQPDPPALNGQHSRGSSQKKLRFPIGTN